MAEWLGLTGCLANSSTLVPWARPTTVPGWNSPVHSWHAYRQMNWMH